MRTPLNTRSLSVAAVSIAAALALSACASSDNSTSNAAPRITLENCGEQITLDAPPSRAVTMNQGATESALSVGAQDQMIGTAYLDDEIAPQWAAAYAQIPVLAPAAYPSRETLLELKPDLVLASYSTAFDDKEGVGMRDSLSELGIATYVSPFSCEDKAKRLPASWDSIASEIADYGTLFGQTAVSEEVNTQMRATLEQVSAAAPAQGKTILWYDSGTDEPFVGAGGGGPQLIIDALGGVNIFADSTGAWDTMNWEPVLVADPDVIVLADASWSTADEKKAYLQNDPALRDLKAVRGDAFVILPFSTTTPGPRTIEGAIMAAEQLN
ncbi:ABC transporter substrate-binding protein [Tomitella biformata]|uniref:ABC transporter substrate-binding protein n=1 Tax=Tomitella biformata TaxID=630403 RepID=UPI000464E50A|nr:ABC transporter substrate-binding protein [Tomitella biformata]